jgi:hypothetical protein
LASENGFMAEGPLEGPGCHPMPRRGRGDGNSH